MAKDIDSSTVCQLLTRVIPHSLVLSNANVLPLVLFLLSFMSLADENSQYIYCLYQGKINNLPGKLYFRHLLKPHPTFLMS